MPLLLSVNEQDSRPIYAQLAAQVKAQIQEGSLSPGDALPPIREVEDSLNINLHTVRSAYQKLRDEGIISLRLGRRARVTKRRHMPASPETIQSKVITPLQELITEAYHLGLSPDDFRKLVSESLDKQPRR